jgi:ectoine hydroxylase-related dioxygenase (phytanoyl-CoA dioxygenase family)
MEEASLSKGQIDGFIERGWTLLRQAFSPTVAHAVRRDLGGRIGIHLERPEQWTQPRVWLQEMMTVPPYTDALTERFHAAVDQLVGPENGTMTQEMGWWPIPFPGFENPPYGEDWHIEGNWLRHHVISPEQALLTLFSFLTVDAGGGGTLLVEGSHHLAARLLWDVEPEGLDADDFDQPLTAMLDQAGWPGVTKVVAEEGDVVLAHPLICHASNPNGGSCPRIMAQPALSMTKPMRNAGDGLRPGRDTARSGPAAAHAALAASAGRSVAGGEQSIGRRVSHSLEVTVEYLGKT